MTVTDERGVLLPLSPPNTKFPLQIKNLDFLKKGPTKVARFKL